MKSWLIVTFIAVLLVVPGFGFSVEEMEADGISLKAGPTDVTEELSLAWVEAALYPKTIEKNREIFVEVRLASPVKGVKLTLDSEKGSVPLFSDDNKSWSRVVKVSPGAASGMHIAKITIMGNNDKSIQRSLDYVVRDDAQTSAATMPLTVLSATQVVENGETVRQLLPGVKVTAVYKAPFYRVKLDDEKEGWVEASKVKEPTDELYLLGFRAYQNKEYQSAINYFNQTLQFDPKHAQAHVYLAKIYLKQDKFDLAAREVKESLLIEPDNPKVQAMAEVLAQKYLDEGIYAKAFELKPKLLVDRLSQRSRERIAVEARAYKKPEVKVVKAPAAPPVAAAPEISKDILSDSIDLVKRSKTGKGNSVMAAVNSVITMTKSLGTKIYEDGWKVAAASDGLRVVFACRQERAGKLEAENFEWKIDPDRRSAIPMNDNARLLMNRW